MPEADKLPPLRDVIAAPRAIAQRSEATALGGATQKKRTNRNG
jgi:hypothetical protein